MARARQQFIDGSISINVLLSFIFGTIFVAVMLVFAVFHPNPSPSAQTTFTTVLALAAAGVGAMLPGELGISRLPLVRASGAVALFVLVYLFQPQIVKSVAKIERPVSDAKPVYMRVLEAVDSGKNEAIIASIEAGVAFFDLSPNEVAELFVNTRTPLGKSLSRQMINSTTAENPAGVPTGIYRMVSFKTKFVKSAQCRPETVTLRGTSDLKWEGFSYQIGITDIPCV